MIELIGKPRNNNGKIVERHYEIASAMQRIFEETVDHLVKVCRNFGSGSENLILSGGAAMNSVYNGILDQKSIYKDSSISSCPDDSGVAVGAALLAHYRYQNKQKMMKGKD